MNEHIPIDYAVLVVSEILLEKGLINRATFDELAFCGAQWPLVRWPVATKRR